MTAIACYMRVSTNHQDTDMQRHAIQNWLTDNRPGQEYRFYVDMAMSGSRDDRPEFQKLQRDIDNGSVSAVVVYRLDRLSRKAITAIHLVLDWIKRDLDFIAVDQPALSATADDSFRLTRIAMFSELAQIERETTVRRIKSGLDAARARGKKLGRPRSIPRTKIRELLGRGVGASEVARQTGVSRRTVYRVAQEHGQKNE